MDLIIGDSMAVQGVRVDVVAKGQVSRSQQTTMKVRALSLLTLDIIHSSPDSRNRGGVDERSNRKNPTHGLNNCGGQNYARC